MCRRAVDLINLIGIAYILRPILVIDQQGTYRKSMNSGHIRTCGAMGKLNENSGYCCLIPLYFSAFVAHWPLRTGFSGTNMG